MNLDNSIISDLSNILISHATSQFSSSIILSEEEVGYSKLSLYFTLALYIITIPGLFSLVSRSVKVKPTQRIYDLPGPANPTAKPLRQTAGEVMAYFKALNYEPTIAAEVITFKGILGRSNSQAAFLTFCTFMALGSLGLILSIIFPDIGNNAYFVTLLSPYAGIYYWNNAQRLDEVQVKMETSDDEQITTIYAVGGKEELDRFSSTLNLPERGKVYVKGIFDTKDVNSFPIVSPSIPTSASSSAVNTTSSNLSVDKTIDEAKELASVNDSKVE